MNNEGDSSNFISSQENSTKTRKNKDLLAAARSCFSKILFFFEGRILFTLQAVKRSQSPIHLHSNEIPPPPRSQILSKLCSLQVAFVWENIDFSQVNGCACVLMLWKQTTEPHKDANIKNSIAKLHKFSHKGWCLCLSSSGYHLRDGCYSVLNI